MTIRIFDVLPGGAAWLAVGGVILGAVYAPLALLWVVAGLALYLAVRFTLAALVARWGLGQIRHWETIDWQVDYTRRAAADSLPLEAVHHLVLIPNANEEISILRRTLDGLAAQKRASSSISVVLAMEAAEPGSAEKGAALQTEYETCFAHLWVTVHPAGLPGEVPCKSANLAWAARWASHKLVDDLGCNLDHLIVTVLDADTLWHPRYFESLGVLFATDPRRYATYWQAPIRYHGNVWASHPLLRLLHAYASAWELAYLTAPWWKKLPMSSYSLSLCLLDHIGYWDPDAIADEWHMYLKSYFGYDGKQHLQPIYLPFLVNATPGYTIWRAIRERYRQTFRHAWGAKEIGYTLACLLGQRRGLSWDACRLLGRVTHDNVMSGAGWVVLFLGSQLPLLLHPAWGRAQLPRLPFILMQLSLLAVAILTVLFWVFDLSLRPPRPAPWTLRERLGEGAGLLLMAVLTVVCVTLPVLHAQTRLMLGKTIRFRVAAKL